MCFYLVPSSKRCKIEHILVLAFLFKSIMFEPGGQMGKYFLNSGGRMKLVLLTRGMRIGKAKHSERAWFYRDSPTKEYELHDF